MESNDFSFSVVSIVEDVLQHYSTRSNDAGSLLPRKLEESSLRRYEAAAWLRETLGVSSGRDFPAEPSEEDFRLGLRSGIVLCNVLNKVNPGSVSKVVEAPDDVADGAALSAFQYFENIRNFLVAIEEMGLPSFEASDMEKGGKSIRIVNCILALKSYSEWKLKGGTGPFRYGSNMKNNFGTRKPFLRKSSEPFMSSMSINHSSTDQPLCSDVGQVSGSINGLVRSFLSDRKPEDIPSVIESVLNKVMEEVQQRLSIHNEMMKSSSKPIQEDDSSCEETVVPSQQCEVRQHEETEENSPSKVVEEKIQRINTEHYEEQEILLNQQKHIQELKQTLSTTKAGMRLLQKKYQEDFFHLGNHVNGLAHAATGYKRVLEENRKLYNLVQDLKEEVFSDMQPLVRSVLDGYNVCIFAYGQTGSGKTFTMLMDLGQMNRAVSSTAMNDRSSRSHSCVTVHVQGRDLTSGTIIHGSMHLVDLAGSERVDKSEVTGDRLKEAQHINKSLSALGDVISSLSQKTSHVPYRNSKLTQLLQDSLGGSAKTLMFVHISPEADTLGEAISTLKFAERVGSVELGAARVNKDNSEVKELKEQIINLKMALARKGNGNDAQPTSLPHTPERVSRRRSLETPSVRPKLPNIGNAPSNLRQPFSDTASSRRHTLDLHELMRRRQSLNANEEDRESKSGEWIDKQDLEVQSVTDNESDEGVASDCSDSDLLWRLNVQVNVPRVANKQSSENPKPRKVQTRTTKLSETRSLIPSLIPAPSKRTPNTVNSQPQQRVTRDGKRRLSLGK
uniref:Kinesin-like protein n=1 Tax=Brassica campestris TaxID=3711 RepID=M4F695_BRACM